MFSSRCGSFIRSCVSSLSSPASASSSSTKFAAFSKTSPFTHTLTRTLATEVHKPTTVNEALSRTQVLFKTYKPITPGTRHLKRPLNPHLWEGSPLRLLTVPLRRKGGRNNQGRITVRFRGGGHRRRIRLVDFMRSTPGPHDVVRIEYDPGRSAHIALLKNRDPNANGRNVWSYILAPEGLRAGHVVQSFRQGIPSGFVPGYVDPKASHGKASEEVQQQQEDTTEREITLLEEGEGEVQTTSTDDLALGILRSVTVRLGNVLPLRLIPTGTIVHNIALHPDGRGMLVRSAGTFAQVIAHEESGRYTQVRLQSGEVRKVLQDCVATIGRVSNPLWKNRNLGKAGRNRWLGRRPHVRGMAMNRYGLMLFSVFYLYVLMYPLFSLCALKM